MTTGDTLSLDLVKLISSYTPKFVYTFYYKGDIYINRDKEKCIRELVSRVSDTNECINMSSSESENNGKYHITEQPNEIIVYVHINQFLSSMCKILKTELN